MKQILNGFQCGKCSSIYDNKEKAETYEKQPIEEPLLKIGDLLIDDSYGVENEIRVSKIFFNEHQVNYLMEWQSPDGNGEWDELYTIYGNEHLSEWVVDPCSDVADKLFVNNSNMDEKCEQCHENEATTLRLQKRNGLKKEIHLCDECAGNE